MAAAAPPAYTPPAPPAPVFTPPPPPAPPPAPVPPRAEVQWHYSVGGKAQGPVAESVLRVALQSLPADTLVWHAGLPAWKTAAEAGLKQPAAPAPAFNSPPAAAYGGFGSSSPAAPRVAPAPPPTAPIAAPYGPPAPAAAPFRAPMAGYPMPPDMHWAVVLILSWVTGGLAGLIWAFKQAGFVKRIDPSSKAVLLFAITVIGLVVQLVLVFSAMSSGSASSMMAVSGIAMLINLVVAVCGLVAVFSMRSSIVRHYNSAEPIGLQLSGVMTFFFSILYFQYHFSRIASWKKTGQWS